MNKIQGAIREAIARIQPDTLAVIVERSLTSGYGFALRDYDQGHFTKRGWKAFHRAWRNAIKSQPRTYKTIFLKCSTNEAANRILARQHSDMNFYTSDDLINIAAYQERVFPTATVINSDGMGIDDLVETVIDIVQEACEDHKKNLTEKIDASSPSTNDPPYMAATRQYVNTEAVEGEEREEEKGVHSGEERKLSDSSARKVKKAQQRAWRKGHEPCEKCQQPGFYRASKGVTTLKEEQEISARRQCALCETCWNKLPNATKKMVIKGNSSVYANSQQQKQKKKAQEETNMQEHQ